MDPLTLRLWIERLWRLALLLIVTIFALWVWPTRFRYDHIFNDGNTYPVRIDRFSGDSDMLVPDEGWVPVEGDSNGNPNDNQTTGHRAPRS